MQKIRLSLIVLVCISAQVFAGSLEPPEALGDFIKDALSAGSDGICIYHYDAMTDTDFDVFGRLCS